MASYATAWQLFAVALLVTGLVWFTAPEQVSWRLARLLAAPGAAVAVLGGICSIGDYLKDDAWRWYGPWTALRAAGPGFVYAWWRRDLKGRG